MIGLRNTGLLLLVLMAALPTPAEEKSEKPKVAVANFDTFLVDKEFGQVVPNMLCSDLIALGAVQLVEREQLERVLQEQKLSLSDIVNPNQAVATGKVAGVDRMIIGSVGKLGLVVVLSARTVDTRSGQIFGAWSLTGKEEGELRKMIEDLARRISGKDSTDYR